MESIKIPYNFNVEGKYTYQGGLFNCLSLGYKRACVAWHRRAGKDKVMFNLMIKEACQRKGLYYYFFPTYSSGKKIIWEGIDEDGFRFLDHIPPAIRDGEPNVTELKVRLYNGSIIQIIGTDQYDAIRGTNPVGCVFSEYAFQDAGAWEVVKPILRKNGGWALFNSTPNGENHFYELLKMAENNPKWYTEILTIADTGILTEEDMEEERAEGTPEEMIQQEYYCSFESSSVGRFIVDMQTEGRFLEDLYDPNQMVFTGWDIGVGDSTAIWFFQEKEKTLDFIDYYSFQGVGMTHYADYINSLGYKYHMHYFPHDAQQRQKNETAERIVDIITRLGVKPITIIPKTANIISDIYFVRKYFKDVRIDENKCRMGIKSLKSYRKEYDSKRKAYRTRPVHDWASNGADAFRIAILGARGGAIGNIAVTGTKKTRYLPVDKIGDPFDFYKRKMQRRVLADNWN